MASHGVSADGHPLGVGGEVSVDQFGELRDRQAALAGSEVKRSGGTHQTHLLSHIGVHAVVGVPGVLRGVHVKTSSSAEVPALILTLDVTTA